MDAAQTDAQDLAASIEPLRKAIAAAYGVVPDNVEALQIEWRLGPLPRRNPRSFLQRRIMVEEVDPGRLRRGVVFESLLAKSAVCVFEVISHG